jgi:hypothetical protein
MTRARASRLRIFLATAALGFAGGGFLLLRPHPLDSPRDLLLSVLVRERTEYAPHYSNAGFARIERDMSEAEVQDLVGQPLDKVETTSVHGEQQWLVRYSRPRGDASFWERNVLYGYGGRVLAKSSGLFID